MTIATVARPYTLTFRSGNQYLISSEEAQRLIDGYPAISATRNRVKLQAHDPAEKYCTLTPATLGGGPAFLISR